MSDAAKGLAELIERVERDFAALLAAGWPKPVEHKRREYPRPRIGALDLMLFQLPDSAVPETRFFWRKKLGFTDAIASDPRPLAASLRTHAAGRRA